MNASTMFDVVRFVGCYASWGATSIAACRDHDLACNCLGHHCLSACALHASVMALTQLYSTAPAVLCVLLQVSDEYNSPEIILLTYPLESMWDGSLTPNQTTYYLQYMASLYAQTQMQGMSNVYLLQLNGVDFPINDWCAGHPNVAAHQNIANQLTDYIHAVLPDWAEQMYSSMD